MIALWLLFAHTQTIERTITVQPDDDGGAAVLVVMRVPARLKPNIDRGFVTMTLSDIAIDVDGQPAECDRSWRAPGLTNSAQTPFDVAVLLVCAPGEVWSMTIGSKLPTRAGFGGAGAHFAAVESEEGPIRRFDWVGL